ncbi:TolB family protein [Rhodococcus sp. NPDC057297]|uniref:TolB family protein n=1 Tax=Rhodococcus sp. NPDC057297 TaxID=3346090 RepID=UPI00363E682B
MRLIRSMAVLFAASALLVGCSEDPPAPPAPVVVSFDDGWGQVFVMNADGTGLRQVTPTVAEDMSDGMYANYTALSPDGTQLVYTRAGRTLEAVDLASGESRTLHEGGYQPAFSPDGSMIAFTSGGSISVMNADGSDVRVVAQEDSAFGSSFSPDGSRILFDIAGYILEVPASGGESTVILRDQFWNADAVYSPDGSTLVFSSNRGGNNGSEIYSMPVGGGEITQLTTTYAVHPEFSPDGSRIFYTRATTQSGELVTDIGLSNRAELASMNLDGSDQKRLTPRSITGQNPSIGGGR